MNVLGISCFFHDAAAALLRHGELVAASEEERFSRRKHDPKFPSRAIQFCLEQGEIGPKELDYVVFYEDPYLKFDRILKTSFRTFPKSLRLFQEAMVRWLGGKLWMSELIQDHFGIPADRVLFSGHHRSHAASAFFCSPYQKAAFLTVDGVGEWTTASYGIGDGTRLEIINEIHFPHSVGLLYSAFTDFLGFEVNEGEYKVMGMAPFGQPRYAGRVRQLIDTKSDGSFELKMEYFSFHYSTQRAFNKKFESLFGEPRERESSFFMPDSEYPSYFGEKPADYEARAERNSYYADVAASVQTVTEEMVVGMAQHVHEETGLDSLCMAGGVALNSVANGKILRETPFTEIYVQPAAGDGGGALGAALYAYHSMLDHPRRFVMKHAYWGRQYDCGEIEQFLDKENISYSRIDDEDQLLREIVAHLVAGDVIGWFQGRFEWGPRALGNRSILADPRREDMKDRVNTKIKFREPYRPFAPSVLAERVSEFFDLPDAHRHFPTRFMLYVVNVKEDKKSLIPAVTHVDGTARLQVVDRESAPRYHRLIELFGESTEVPVLLNTSFNLRGEPIVSSPENAFNTFSQSGMDVLVLERFIIRKTDLEHSAQDQ